MADKNLTVKIRGDNAGLGKALNRSKSQIGQFGSFLKGFGARFGLIGGALVGTAAGAGAIKLFVDTTKEIDQLTKLGKQFGLSTEQVQVFERVAELTGTNLQQLLKGFGQLTKSMLQFARDGSGPGKKVFEDLGLSSKQLGDAFKKGPVGVLKTFGDALNKIEDPLKKSALLEELLGARNKELAVALFDVSKEFGGAAEDIKKLGLALTEEDTQAVEDYNDAWTKVFNTIENLTRKTTADLTKKLLPAVEDLNSALEHFIQGETGFGFEHLGAAVNRGAQSLREEFPQASLALSSNPFTGPLINGIQAAGAVLEHGFDGVFERIRANVAGGVAGAGKLLGFPLTGGALADIIRGPQRNLPRPGEGTINGRSLRDILEAQPGAGAGIIRRTTPGNEAPARAIADIMADVSRQIDILGIRDQPTLGLGQVPTPGTGEINGRSIDSILAESKKQTGELSILNRNMGSFILNERTGVRTAVAAP